MVEFLGWRELASEASPNPSIAIMQAAANPCSTGIVGRKVRIQLYVGHLLRQEIKPIRTPPLAAFARRLLACLLVE